MTPILAIAIMILAFTGLLTIIVAVLALLDKILHLKYLSFYITSNGDSYRAHYISTSFYHDAGIHKTSKDFQVLREAELFLDKMYSEYIYYKKINTWRRIR